jgi:hypothetical protein
MVVWTLDEIHAMPETGDWFFGVVADKGRHCLAEVFPGTGYVPIKAPYPWWNPWSWLWLFQDVLRTERRRNGEAVSATPSAE